LERTLSGKATFGPLCVTVPSTSSEHGHPSEVSNLGGSSGILYLLWSLFVQYRIHNSLIMNGRQHILGSDCHPLRHTLFL